MGCRPLSLLIPFYQSLHSALFTQNQENDLEARLIACKEAFYDEVTLLNSKSQEYWENGQKEKEERMKVITKVGGRHLWTIFLPHHGFISNPTIL